ncbi:MAG: 30S ribosomal protein S17 [Armatimonadota bacterium]|nr:30S ribosomal protein S17 [Armatimonadota bacterium]MDR5702362.1 30S ribosomal protein S17 [Armatimonadota bacterium]MDR7435455.1 30S ribosomal protein S17 [Armatimonadota bacterium]
MSERRKKRKTMVGTVVSDKMDKTVVVRVETLRRHPLYKKTIRHIKKVKAHDEENACRVGDKVLIMETRPLSKEKRWRVVQILERGKEAIPVEAVGSLTTPPTEV